MGWWEAERAADGIRELAKTRSMRPSVIARRLGIRVVRVPGMLDRGNLGYGSGRWWIAIRNDDEHTIGHELKHWWDRINGVIESTEESADMVGAALMMPSPSFADAVRRFGRNFSALARHFRATESSVALRLGEVQDVPLALVTPQSVRVRGPEFWEWGSQEFIRHVAKTGRPGVAVLRLHDDRRRTVVIAA